MKTIIYYYTLTGNCEKLANKLASKFNCETEKIVEKKKRLFSKGFLRFFNGGEAIQKKISSIEELKNKPGDFDRIITVTPFWAASPTPAIRGFTKEYFEDLKGKKLGLIVTNLGSDPEEAFKKYEKIFPESLIEMSFTKANGEWDELKQSDMIDFFAEEFNK